MVVNETDESIDVEATETAIISPLDFVFKSVNKRFDDLERKLKITTDELKTTTSILVKPFIRNIAVQILNFIYTKAFQGERESHKFCDATGHIKERLTECADICGMKIAEFRGSADKTVCDRNNEIHPSSVEGLYTMVEDAKKLIASTSFSTNTKKSLTFEIVLIENFGRIKTSFENFGTMKTSFKKRKI
jgi:hypothetical protein